MTIQRNLESPIRVGAQRTRARALDIPNLPHGRNLIFDWEFVVVVPQGIRQGTIKCCKPGKKLKLSSRKLNVCIADFSEQAWVRGSLSPTRGSFLLALNLSSAEGALFTFNLFVSVGISSRCLILYPNAFYDFPLLFKLT